MQSLQYFTRMLRADIASTWLRDGESMHRALIINRPVASIPKLVMVSDIEFGGLLPQGQGTLRIDDIHSDPRFLQQNIISKEGLKSFMSHPIAFHGQIIGVMYFMRRGDVPFDERDAKTLSLGSSMLSVAIDHCSFSNDAPRLWESMLREFCDGVVQAHGTEDSAYNCSFLKPVWLLSDDLPKGIHPLTLARVFDYIQNSRISVSSADIAGVSGLSLASARRYLNHLYDTGQLQRDLVYTPVGRPSYLYSLADD